MSSEQRTLIDGLPSRSSYSRILLSSIHAAVATRLNMISLVVSGMELTPISMLAYRSVTPSGIFTS